MVGHNHLHLTPRSDQNTLWAGENSSHQGELNNDALTPEVYGIHVISSSGTKLYVVAPAQDYGLFTFVYVSSICVYINYTLFMCICVEFAQLMVPVVPCMCLFTRHLMQ